LSTAGIDLVESFGKRTLVCRGAAVSGSSRGTCINRVSSRALYEFDDVKADG
jgi:hypothetical protein